MMQLRIPSHTRFEERCIIAPGDVFISSGAQLGYGLESRAISLGNRVVVQGDLRAKEHIWIGSFSKIQGNIHAGSDVYLGDFVQVDGGIYAQGELELGKSVSIGEKLEAKKGILIRSSMIPLIWIIWILIQLLNPCRLQLPGDANQLLIPPGARITPNKISTKHPVRVGRSSRILGSIYSSSEVILEPYSNVLGKIWAPRIVLGKGSKVYGDLISDRTRIQDSAKVIGNLRSRDVELEGNPRIEGIIDCSRILFCV